MQKTSLFGVEYAEHVTVCQRWRRCFIPAAAAPCSQHIADGLPRHARNPWVRGLPACRSDGEIEHAAHFPAPRPELPLRSSLIARRNSQKTRTIRAPSLRRVDAGRGGAPCGSLGQYRLGSQARNRRFIAALFAYLLAAHGGEIYVA